MCGGEKRCQIISKKGDNTELSKKKEIIVHQNIGTKIKNEATLNRKKSSNYPLWQVYTSLKSLTFFHYSYGLN